jgi:hypothetical protein
LAATSSMRNSSAALYHFSFLSGFLFHLYLIDSFTGHHSSNHWRRDFLAHLSSLLYPTSILHLEFGSSSIVDWTMGNSNDDSFSSDWLTSDYILFVYFLLSTTIGTWEKCDYSFKCVSSWQSFINSALCVYAHEDVSVNLIFGGS